jgi:DNA-binding transcriptional LysR family regulator
LRLPFHIRDHIVAGEAAVDWPDQMCASTVVERKSAHPRERALSPILLDRIFHQPAMIYFRIVAEVLSVRECARRLNVASSAVSRQIAHLEDALGMALFEREGRRLKLTAAGGILLRHVRRTAAPLEAAVSELDMLRGLKTGSVRIAAAESVGLSFLPPFLASFSRLYPALHLEVLVTTASEVVASIVDESVDVGFGFMTRPSSKIEMEVRRDVRIGVLMRPDHPLANVPRLTLDECFRHAVAVGKHELSIREAIQPILDASSSSPAPVLEASSVRLLVELALHGHHVSIMTPIGAHNEIGNGSLVFRPLTDPGIPANRFGLMVRAGTTLHFAPAVFYEHAKEHFRTLEFPGTVFRR